MAVWKLDVFGTGHHHLGSARLLLTRSQKWSLGKQMTTRRASSTCHSKKPHPYLCINRQSTDKTAVKLQQRRWQMKAQMGLLYHGCQLRSANRSVNDVRKKVVLQTATNVSQRVKVQASVVAGRYVAVVYMLHGSGLWFETKGYTVKVWFPEENGRFNRNPNGNKIYFFIFLTIQVQATEQLCIDWKKIQLERGITDCSYWKTGWNKKKCNTDSILLWSCKANSLAAKLAPAFTSSN